MRLRLLRQAPKLPIIYDEDSSVGGGADAKRVRAPELDTCLEVVTTSLAESPVTTRLFRR